MMRKYLIFVFPTLFLFPSCMMHQSMPGMSGMHQQDRVEKPLIIHVMDERYHVDITIHPEMNGYILLTFSVIQARTNNPVESIKGWLIDDLIDRETPLLPDQSKIGVYTVVMSEVVNRKRDTLLLLELSNEDEGASIFEFTLQPSHQHDGHHGRRTRGINLTTTAIIGGTAMAVMMIVMQGWWIFK